MAAMNTDLSAQALLDERSLSRLKWRCRRGLLENDLFIERFFRRFEGRITVGQAQGLEDLMALADNDLLDLLLKRKQADELETDSVLSVQALEVLQTMHHPHAPAPIAP